MFKTYTMKKYFILIGICISLLSSAQNKDIQSIQQLLDKQVAAWNTGNIEAFMLGYWENDSLLFSLGVFLRVFATHDNELQTEFLALHYYH